MKTKIIFLISIIGVGILTLMLTGNIPSNQKNYNNGVIQVGVVVEDLEESEKFYREVIGMKKVGTHTADAELAKKAGLTEGIPINVSTFKLKEADDREATQWKLMSFPNEVNHENPQYLTDDLGMQYISIFPKSLSPIIERIKKNDIEMLGETPVELYEDWWLVVIQDPDGIFIEIMGEM